MVGRSCMFSYLEAAHVRFESQAKRRNRNAQLASKLWGDLQRLMSRVDVERERYERLVVPPLG